MNYYAIAGKLRFALQDYLLWVKSGKHKILILCLAFIMLAMNFLPEDLIDPFGYKDLVQEKSTIKKVTRTEHFNKQIAGKFKSVDNLVLYVQMYSKHPDNKFLLLQDTYRLLKQRFIHAYSVYNLRENWIAVLAGRLIWQDLAAKVIPEDIMQGDAAACSQVSIIFMSACEKLGIPTRKVGLVGHYALEAYIEHQWYFFDADLKPDFNAIKGHKSLAKILNSEEQFPLYQNTILDSADIQLKFSKVDYGLPNAAPAPRAYLFHVVTKAASHWAWLVPLSCSIGCFIKKRRPAKKLQVAISPELGSNTHRISHPKLPAAVGA